MAGADHAVNWGLLGWGIRYPREYGNAAPCVRTVGVVWAGNAPLTWKEGARMKGDAGVQRWWRWAEGGGNGNIMGGDTCFDQLKCTFRLRN